MPLRATGWSSAIKSLPSLVGSWETPRVEEVRRLPDQVCGKTPEASRACRYRRSYHTSLRRGKRLTGILAARAGGLRGVWPSGNRVKYNAGP
jgi:hypothetical protein